MEEQFKDYVTEALNSNFDAMKRAFNAAMDDRIEKNNALKSMVTALKEQIVELKRSSLSTRLL